MVLGTLQGMYEAGTLTQDQGEAPSHLWASVSSSVKKKGFGLVSGAQWTLFWGLRGQKHFTASLGIGLHHSLPMASAQRGLAEAV